MSQTLAPYFVDGKYGDYFADVAPWATGYVAWAREGYQQNSDERPPTWVPRMDSCLDRASSAGLRIHFLLGGHPPYLFFGKGNIPFTNIPRGFCKKYLPYIDRIELADELKAEGNIVMTPADLQSYKNVVKSQFKTWWGGTSWRPPQGYGVTFSQAQVDHPDFKAYLPIVDWVGLECYVDPPPIGSPQQHNVALAIQKVQATTMVQIAKVKKLAPSKKIVLCLMSYDRNYDGRLRQPATKGWEDPALVAALQDPVYQIGRTEPNVIGYTSFAWGRPGGCTTHPEIAARVREVGMAVW